MQRHDRDRASNHTQPGVTAVENYTVPFLVTAGVLCFVILFYLWAYYGMLATILLAWAVDRFFLDRSSL